MEKKLPAAIPAEELEKMEHYAALLAARADELVARGERRPRALIETYGCQQNVADSDRMRGMLELCGYDEAESRKDADFILFNTCAVREHAELRVLGNIGALKHEKEERPGLVIGICGCMMQQEHRVREIMEKYRHVSVVFGTHTFYKLPELLYSALEGERRAEVTNGETAIPEGLPVKRSGGDRAFVTIMYGCNNFCTYCIVPYTRGRERSREREKILEEVRSLAAAGIGEIMLLGQNVNSYGKDRYEDYRFADLLREIDGVPGDFTLKFMTSHPKDLTREVIDAMAESRHVARELHLPVQSGSDRILKKMNRHYTAESYKQLIAYARERMPDIRLTSDIIVGFPTETEEDFEATLALVREVRYFNLFTFIYSKRSGTPAATMEGQVEESVKKERIARLIEVQTEIRKQYYWEE